tara:strand:+ start:31987 stop:34680 length:2694 start_codon:yes stop_codon:yes gene_type:complete
MIRNIIIWLCILQFSEVVHSQVFFSDYQKLTKKYNDNLPSQVVDSIIAIALSDTSEEEVIQIIHDYAVSSYKKGEYQTAIKYGIQEIKVYEKNDLLNEAYVQALYNLGRFYFKNSNYEASKSVHEKIIALNYNDEVTGTSLFEIGNCYFALGDYYKAIDHFKIALVSIKKSGKQRLYIRRALDLTNRYEQINTKESLEQKSELLEEILYLSKHVQISVRDHYALYNSLASYYNNDETFDFEKSKYYQLQFLQKAIENNDSANMAISYGNLGNLYSLVKNDSAVIYLQKAISIQNEEDKIIRTYNNLAHHYLRNQQWGKALIETQQTLQKIAGSNLAPNSPPNFKIISKFSDKFSVLRAFNLEATAYIKLYEADGNIEGINKAYTNLLVADQVIDLLQLESDEQKSKLHWREQASSLYSKMIYCAIHLNKHDKAFFFNEKNKALLLTEAILLNSERAQLPKDIRNKEIELKKRIISLEHHESSSTSFSEELFETKQRLEEFQDSVKNIYPRYFTNSDHSTLLSLFTVQQKLKKNTVAVSFVWDSTDEFLDIAFGIFITKNKIIIEPIEDIVRLQNLIKEFRKSISSPFETQSQQTNFRNISYQLHNLLFPSEKIKRLIADKDLLIIPDNVLQGIPFEALISQENLDEYLILQHKIHYAYSLSFLFQNASIFRKTAKAFIGFAPVNFQDEDLEPLPNTVKEISNIQQLINGETFTNKQATKELFLKNSKDYKIIHLATHADIGTSPWIAFSDNKLNLNELYTVQNNAELIVLSACNTSLGEYAVGEGTLSLTRGFFYSGANSVVSTLWSVNDSSTSEILTTFYQNLSKGMSRSEALRSAKLKYLSNHSLSETSPYYWAPLILTGNETPINFAGIMNHSSIILFLILLGISIFLVSRFKM